MAHHYCIVDIKHSKSFNVSFLLASDQLSAADDDMPFQTPSLTSSALSEALATRAREMFSCCCGILRENACQIRLRFVLKASNDLLSGDVRILRNGPNGNCEEGQRGVREVK